MRPRHASVETDMHDWRPTCLIGDQRGLIGILTHVNILIFIYFLLIYIYWNNILGHVGFRWISLMMHVEVSDEACRGLR